MPRLDNPILNALNEVDMQGVKFTQEELTTLNMIQKSPEARKLFAEISSFLIENRSNIKNFLEAVAEGRVFLSEILAHPSLQKYNH